MIIRKDTPKSPKGDFALAQLANSQPSKAPFIGGWG
jgi:hypothetical protein